MFMAGGTTSYNVEPPHIPVLKDEVIELLRPKNGGLYVDGTFGAGGHTRAILEAADCNVFAIDRDPHVSKFAAEIAKEYKGRFMFAEGRFGDMETILKESGIEKVDGILLDIGVSSMQIDTPRRGFSFMNDGPLDMRMEGEGRDAQFLINNAEEEEIAGIIFRYGDEKFSRRIARQIVNARTRFEITRTSQLADIIEDAVGGYNDTIHPATRTFQALRMWVNDELAQLEQGLDAAERILAPGGRFAVITFHSGEDVIVKKFFNEKSGKVAGLSRHQPFIKNIENHYTFSLVTKKAVVPQDSEVARNVRARSAKLRVVEKLEENVSNQKWRTMQ